MCFSFSSAYCFTINAHGHAGTKTQPQLPPARALRSKHEQQEAKCGIFLPGSGMGRGVRSVNTLDLPPRRKT
jgi:hypothetical protein